jgi:tetratricopeptide (TPR) repeat protein
VSLPSPSFRRLRWLVALGCAALSAASAAAEPSSLWEEAAADPEQQARALRYEAAMHTGHELGKAAMRAELDRQSSTSSPAVRAAMSNRAVQAFRDAAAIDPTQAEPHYYIAFLLTQTRLICSSCTFDPAIAQEAVAAITAFEQRSPLDPRISIWLLTQRALLHTRLAGASPAGKSQHLEAALADYRTLVDRRSAERVDSDLVYGNMAETLMMLGDLEEAIVQYRHSLRMRPSSSNTLGLAVALDRDERGTEARALIRELGRTAIGEWEYSVASGDTFYVPAGEVFYYNALVQDALGNRTAAIELYDRFIQSDAHPQFAARAAANRDALLAKKRP